MWLVPQLSYADTCVNENNEKSDQSTIIIYFANGVWNLPADAEDSLNHICKEYQGYFDSQYPNETFEYRKSYNKTYGKIKDVGEVFDQKILEELGLSTPDMISLLNRSAHDMEKELEKQFLNVLNTTQNSGDIIGPGTTVDSQNQMLQQTLELRRKFISQVEIYNKYIAERIDSLQIEDSEVEDHVEEYTRALSSGKKILIIAHSQGNLFTNRALDIIYDDSEYDSYHSSIAYISVATPADRVSGGFEYITAEDDFVIRGLRALSTKSVLDANTDNEFRDTIDLPYVSDVMNIAFETQLLGGRDIVNHGFVYSYLDPIYESLASRKKLDIFIPSLINNLISSRIQDINDNGIIDILEPPEVDSELPGNEIVLDLRNSVWFSDSIGCDGNMDRITLRYSQTRFSGEINRSYLPDGTCGREVIPFDEPFSFTNGSPGFLFVCGDGQCTFDEINRVVNLSADDPRNDCVNSDGQKVAATRGISHVLGTNEFLFDRCGTGYMGSYIRQ